MKAFRKYLYVFLIVLLLCVFGFSAWKLISYYSESAETQAGYDALSQLRQEAVQTVPTAPPQVTAPEGETPPKETEPDPHAGLILMTDVATGKEVWMRPEFASLFAINPDIIGWISIEGTHIDYPVVQRTGTKDYYLYRDFYGKQVMRGCIYAREECDVLKPSDNVTLYGHMMKDSTMFADLAGYRDKSFWEDHRYIRFDSLVGEGLYEVICVFKTSATIGKGFRYHLFVDGETEADLAEFWAGCEELAFYDTGLDPVFGDKLLTLSTCEYTLENGRLVVVARRVEN